jgi:hypothetical protein
MLDHKQTHHPEGTAADLQDYLAQLHAERASASLDELARNANYLADLDEALAHVERAYVATALTEMTNLSLKQC